MRICLIRLNSINMLTPIIIIIMQFESGIVAATLSQSYRKHPSAEGMRINVPMRGTYGYFIWTNPYLMVNNEEASLKVDR